MSTQHDTQLPHLLQKEPATFVGKAGRKKTCEILQNIQVWKILPAEVRTSRPGQGDLCLSTGGGGGQEGARGRSRPQLLLLLSSYHVTPVGSVISSAAAQSIKAVFRSQQSRRSTSACTACWGSAWWRSGGLGTHLSSPPSLGRGAAKRETLVSTVTHTWDLRLQEKWLSVIKWRGKISWYTRMRPDCTS